MLVLSDLMVVMAKYSAACGMCRSAGLVSHIVFDCFAPEARQRYRHGRYLPFPCTASRLSQTTVLYVHNIVNFKKYHFTEKSYVIFIVGVIARLEISCIIFISTLTYISV